MNIQNLPQQFKGQKAISYARASMGKGKGQDDSTDRQKDEAVDYCEQLEMELLLDYTIVDEGVSAFQPTTYIDDTGMVREKAKNLQEGALADFTEIVASGAFPNGINLIVEKLDRLYRDLPRRALLHFLTLLENKVTIHSLMDYHIYQPEGGNDQLDLMSSINALCASHYFSRDSGRRIKLSYDRRIEKMQNITNFYQPTGRVSDWIEKIVNDKGETEPFVSNQNRTIIQRIYSYYIDGLSTRIIANKLNDEGIRSFKGRLWDETRISYVLKSRSVMGHYSPRKGIEISYPSIKIISEGVFKEVQDMLIDNKSLGRRSLDGNIFEGILKCGYCVSEYKRTFNITKEKVYLPSTFTYMPNARQNTGNFPSKVRPPYRGYKCKNGRLSALDCSGARVDYYSFYNSFFSFLQELDFSKLIETDLTIDDKVFRTKLNSLRTELSEIENKIKNLEILSDAVDNVNQKIEYAKQISGYADAKDQVLIKIEDERLKVQKRKKDREEFLENEKNIKNLIKDSETDNEYFALHNMFVPLVTKRDAYTKEKNSKENKPKKLKFSDKEELLYQDLIRLWELHQKIIDSGKEHLKNTNDKDKESKFQKLKKEEMELRQKYFAKEIKKDEKAFHLKKKLNIELRKIIKYIRFYPYGFPTSQPTKPKGDRKEKESCLDWHRGLLRQFQNEMNGIDPSDLKPSQKNGKWQRKEVMDILGIKSRTTWRRYLEAEPKLDPDKKGFDIEYAMRWIKKRRGRDVKNSIVKFENRFFNYFMGFSIEFKDICKKNIIKYVLPYYDDVTSGVSFDLNTETLRMDFNSNFGEKEIKLKRPSRMPKKLREKHQEEGIFYIEDDPIYQKALELMFTSATERQFGFKLGVADGTRVYDEDGLDSLDNTEEEDLKQLVELYENSIKEDTEFLKTLSGDEKKVMESSIKKTKKSLKETKELLKKIQE